MVQLKAGDLDASEYVKMKDKEEVESNFLLVPGFIFKTMVVI